MASDYDSDSSSEMDLLEMAECILRDFLISGSSDCDDIVSDEWDEYQSENETTTNPKPDNEHYDTNINVKWESNNATCGVLTSTEDITGSNVTLNSCERKCKEMDDVSGNRQTIGLDQTGDCVAVTRGILELWDRVRAMLGDVQQCKSHNLVPSDGHHLVDTSEKVGNLDPIDLKHSVDTGAKICNLDPSEIQHSMDTGENMCNLDPSDLHNLGDTSEKICNLDPSDLLHSMDTGEKMCYLDPRDVYHLVDTSEIMGNLDPSDLTHTTQQDVGASEEEPRHPDAVDVYYELMEFKAKDENQRQEYFEQVLRDLSDAIIPIAESVLKLCIEQPKCTNSSNSQHSDIEKTDNKLECSELNFGVIAMALLDLFRSNKKTGNESDENTSETALKKNKHTVSPRTDKNGWVTWIDDIYKLVELYSEIKASNVDSTEDNDRRNNTKGAKVAVMDDQSDCKDKSKPPVTIWPDVAKDVITDLVKLCLWYYGGCLEVTADSYKADDVLFCGDGTSSINDLLHILSKSVHSEVESLRHVTKFLEFIIDLLYKVVIPLLVLYYLKPVNLSNIKAESNIKTESNIRTENKIKAESNIKTGSNIETGSNIKTESNIKAESTIKTDSNIKAQSSIKTKSKIKTGSSIKAEKNIKAESNIKAENNIKTEINIQTKSNITSTSNIKTGSNITSGSNIKTGSKIKSENDPTSDLFKFLNWVNENSSYFTNIECTDNDAILPNIVNWLSSWAYSIMMSSDKFNGLLKKVIQALKDLAHLITVMFFVPMCLNYYGDHIITGLKYIGKIFPQLEYFLRKAIRIYISWFLCFFSKNLSFTRKDCTFGRQLVKQLSFFELLCEEEPTPSEFTELLKIVEKLYDDFQIENISSRLKPEWFHYEQHDDSVLTQTTNLNANIKCKRVVDMLWLRFQDTLSQSNWCNAVTAGTKMFGMFIDDFAFPETTFLNYAIQICKCLLTAVLSGSRLDGCVSLLFGSGNVCDFDVMVPGFRSDSFIIECVPDRPTSVVFKTVRGTFGSIFSGYKCYLSPLYIKSTLTMVPQTILSSLVLLLLPYPRILNIAYSIQVGDVASTVLLFQGKDVILSVDWVPAVSMESWPDQAQTWIHRNHEWPVFEMRESISRGGCHAVAKTPKGGDPHKEWRLSFSKAENTLCKILTPSQAFHLSLLKTQFKSLKLKTGSHAVRIFKNYTITKGVFHTYHAKTVMFWFCENHPPEDEIWRKLNVFRCQSELLESMGRMMREGNIPHYFIPEQNLLEDIPVELLQQAADELSFLKKDARTENGRVYQEIIKQPPHEDPFLRLWNQFESELENCFS